MVTNFASNLPIDAARDISTFQWALVIPAALAALISRLSHSQSIEQYYFLVHLIFDQGQSYI